MTLPGANTLPGARVQPSPTSRDLTLTAVLRPNRFIVTIGAGVPRQIPVSLGGVEYVTADVSEVNGADITAASLEISLGSYTTPGEWRTPDQLTRPSDSSATVGVLVGASYLPTAGRYWPWLRVADSPEVSPIRCSSSVTIT